MLGDVDWVSYGGSWLVTAWYDMLWIITFDNAEEWGDEGFWCEIKLASLSSNAREDALKSCGMAFDNDENIVIPSGETVASREEQPDLWREVIAETLLGHGATARLYCKSDTWTEESKLDEDDFAEKMLEEAHLELLNLQVDKRKFNRKLNSRANKIGATQEDFMNGDPMAPLRQKATDIVCGKEAKLTPTDRIILKIYGAAGGQTLGGKVEVDLALADVMLRGEEDA